MSSPVDRDLFPVLDPPPGGLEALRERVRADETHVIRRRRAKTVVLCVAAAAATVVIVLGLPDLGASSRPLPVPWALEVQAGLADVPAEPVSVPPDARARVALEPVDTDVPGVHLYRVAALR